MSQLFVLFEHAIGYSLYKVIEFEEIGAFIPQVEASICNFSKFVKIVQLFGFKPFKNAVSALENINAVSEGVMTKELSGFLEANLPTSSSKVTLGVCDPKLGASISEVHNLQISHVGVVPEILRGIRFHLVSYIKGLKTTSLKQTELGLGHSYSRGKVKFNVNKADNMIIQSISLLDQLEKDINTFTMRIREWYSYHFPELAKIVTDNYQYALCAHFIKLRTSLDESKFEELENIIQDSDKARAVINAAKMSMGMDISPIDLLNIETFAKRIASLAKYRKSLSEYLKKKMSVVAPNLSVLIGDVIAARLISHAGSLVNLAKSPASTVQIFGAEKALFRALKTHSNTPKYGLIYHSSFIGQADMSNKGRISRFLANKCSMASRIDFFTDNVSTAFGETFRAQVEERLKFYATGQLPQKNVDIMVDAIQLNNVRLKEMRKQEKKRKKEAQQMETAAQEEPEEPPKKKKKAAKVVETVQEQDVALPEVVEAVNSSKKKKKKKNKDMDQSMDLNNSTAVEEDRVVEEVENEQVDYEPSPKKKKKVKKSKEIKEETVDMINGTTAEEDGVLEEVKNEQVDDEPSLKKKKKSKEAREETTKEEVDNSLPKGNPTPDKKKKRKSKGESMEC